ncbi:10023_t:CDS:2, partial [Gigaspora margarita]
VSSGVPPFRAFKNTLARMTKHLIKGNLETPIEGTPVDFKNLYCTAWSDNLDSTIVTLAGVANFWCHHVVISVADIFALVFSDFVIVFAVGHRFLVSPCCSLVLLVLTFALSFAS